MLTYKSMMKMIGLYQKTRPYAKTSLLMSKLGNDPIDCYYLRDVADLLNYLGLNFDVEAVLSEHDQSYMTASIEAYATNDRCCTIVVSYSFECFLAGVKTFKDLFDKLHDFELEVEEIKKTGIYFERKCT
jgi:hypothetical protein